MDEDIEYNEIPREKKVRKKKHYLARFLIIVGVIAAAVIFLLSSFFAIKNVEVTGNNYYSDDEIVNIANVTKGANIFIHAGKSDIKSRLMENPYFSDVTVSRKLPNTLVIKVKERKQVAAIKYGNKYVVIDVNGLVLRTGDVDPEVTILNGLTLSKLKVGEKVRCEEKQTLKNTLAMVASMKKGDFYFKRIDVSNLVIKAYITDMLIVKGTPAQMKKSIDSGDLQKVVNRLFKNGTKRGTISLGEHNYMSYSPAF